MEQRGIVPPPSPSIHCPFLFNFFFARQTMLVSGEQIKVVCPVAVDSCELYGELDDSLYAPKLFTDTCVNSSILAHY